MILWKFHRSRYFTDSGSFNIKTIQYFWKRISLWYLVLYYWFLVSIASRSEILDFGTISVFSELFSRMLDVNLGIRVSDIFIFQDQENIFIYQILFLFPFLYFSFLPLQAKGFSNFPNSKILSKIPTLSNFPHSSPLMPLILSLFFGRPPLAKGDTSSSPFLHKTPLKFQYYISFTNPNPI